ncbi:MAG: PEP-CTERM/exosortase system-associated acyltransferase [Gammaproteobacteria bacterium]|uniref:PEP-CTERM/exosortase system-associated acyltransferase n=1 Tax=Pseudomaricurvus alcaniphilus TaxID=1166482 RepID=UPI001407354B|nr:PEP-CTERM/exosortase system-associated acyltransferase [Pseudomaricurvus alcaniphilus]MBR9912410.1 PEP-CTERM/exosortase system-associated acyltransferase [Gammaproteobacteria bacterium]NHN36757.1 PEP-CTERM/exosortase system-associated acyltransferase [Pseudomaricurvus alcaniphilus]
MTELSIAANFDKYFEVKIADTDALRDQVYGIRYRVYAEEFGFEKAEDFPNKLEKDEFDNKSIHCLISHKASGKPAGCVRVVPTFGSSEKELLPLEKYCAASLDREFIQAMDHPRDSICEISRLAVDTAFRQRPGEKKTRLGSVDETMHSKEEIRSFPLIAVAGFLACISITKLVKRPNTFMMTEPFLPRLLARSGILVERAGSDIDYHGIRAPYFITSQKAAAGLRSDLKELYALIAPRLEQHPALRG